MRQLEKTTIFQIDSGEISLGSGGPIPSVIPGNLLGMYMWALFQDICVFCEETILTRIYEILMNSYESSIIYGVLGQHLMAHRARFEIQTHNSTH